MRKKLGLQVIITSLLIMLCISMNAKLSTGNASDEFKESETVKHLVDTVFVADSLLCLEEKLTLPVMESEQIVLLRKLPYVWLSDDGNVFVFGAKVSQINPNGNKGIEFVRSPEYSVVYLPFPHKEPDDIKISAVTSKMDGEDSRPLTESELKHYNLIGIPVPLPGKESLESFLLKHPDVHKDEKGNIVFSNGRVLTQEDIEDVNSREKFVDIFLEDSLFINR